MNGYSILLILFFWNVVMFCSQRVSGCNRIDRHAGTSQTAGGHRFQQIFATETINVEKTALISTKMHVEILAS